MATLLECEPDVTVVGHARDGQEALDLFHQHQPDVRAEFAHAQIIALTICNGDEDIYRGLQAGAKGYLLKGAEPDELLAAIRTVYNGQHYIRANVAAKLVQRMTNPELSERELEVLRLMAQGMSN